MNSHVSHTSGKWRLASQILTSVVDGVVKFTNLPLQLSRSGQDKTESVWDLEVSFALFEREEFLTEHRFSVVLYHIFTLHAKQGYYM